MVISVMVTDWLAANWLGVDPVTANSVMVTHSAARNPAGVEPAVYWVVGVVSEDAARVELSAKV